MQERRWDALLWIFSLAYTRFAWAYDWLTIRIFGGYWHRWQEACLPVVQGPRVLEIGFGPGHLLQKLSRAGFLVTGVDLAVPMALRLKRRLIKSGLSAEIAVASAVALPFHSETFDTVVTAFPAPWIRDMTSHQEIRRVLKSGGKFIVVDGGRLTGNTPAMRLRRFLLDAAYGPGGGPVDYLGGPRSPWSGEWRRVTVDESHVHLFVGTRQP